MPHVAPDTAWRTIGDVTAATYDRVLGGTPLAPFASGLRDAATPHAALCLSQCWKESGYGRSPLAQATLNPLGLRPGPGKLAPVYEHPTNGLFLVFDSPVQAAAEWRRRITSVTYKDGAYTPKTRTLGEFVAVYAPASDDNNPAEYARQIAELMSAWFAQEAAMPDAPNMTKGLVPLPPFADRLITTKVQGAGWGNYGQRSVKGFVIHRMQGTLWGTDQYFRDPAVRALTDYGCDDQTGEVIRWCNPEGPTISPWASGPVSAPYGDGLAFIQKYAANNLNVVNRDQVSWEIGGYFAQPGETSREDPWSEASRNATAQALAHYAHDYGIPWDAFPIAPQDGFSFVRWHQELCIGTGKVCPGKTVMDATEDLIARAKAILRVYQLGAMPPAPAYAQPDPVEELEGKDGQDVRVGTVDFWWCPRGYNVLKATPVLKYADRGSPKLRADLAPGDRLDAQRVLFAAGEWWAYTSYASRVPLRDCSPVVTFKPI